MKGQSYPLFAELISKPPYLEANMYHRDKNLDNFGTKTSPINSFLNLYALTPDDFSSQLTSRQQIKLLVDSEAANSVSILTESKRIAEPYNNFRETPVDDSCEELLVE